MSGGEAMLRAVLANGVDTVFDLPGVQTYPLYDALKRHENQVRSVHARHELSAAYMAYGYAKSSGRPGVYCSGVSISPRVTTVFGWISHASCLRPSGSPSMKNTSTEPYFV